MVLNTGKGDFSGYNSLYKGLHIDLYGINMNSIKEVDILKEYPPLSD